MSTVIITFHAESGDAYEAGGFFFGAEALLAKGKVKHIEKRYSCGRITLTFDDSASAHAFAKNMAQKETVIVALVKVSYKGAYLGVKHG